ncbi:RNase P modulator RnpM [Bacillus taeanensis]|uniref:DUF448 domain-containing protein n=1 Tax=Bacillus taeanensis TaxID=273032 RepID=A0A366Y0F9_9BACI|nr:YlxR family protein [Bacillus taeanensis]RBW69883.1 DUF448 domain-containing protein [Bacillus taeanensis]
MKNKKKIPLRKCVVSQEMRPKKELFRIVRTPEGEVSLDPTGKKSGRGAYVAKNEEVIQLAKKRNTLNKHLNVEVDALIYEEMLKQLAREKLKSNDA